MSETQQKEFSSNKLYEKQPLREKFQSLTNEQKAESNYKWNEYCGKIINFSDGLSSFSNLAITFFFKDELHLTPSQSAFIQSILSFPYILKPFFGFISDVFPFFGYKRKSYLILNSIIIFFAWMAMACLNLSLYSTISILLIKAICKTFLNACSSAVLVEISKNIKHEKEEKKLETFNTSIIYINLGTILSSTTRGIALEYLPNHVIFFISGVLSCLDIAAGIMYQENKIKYKESTDKNIPKFGTINEDFTYNTKGSCRKLIEVLKSREIVLLSIYMLVMTLVPSYYESSFYYLTDKKNFTRRDFGYLTIILMVLFLTNSVINKNYLNKYSKKKL